MSNKIFIGDPEEDTVTEPTVVVDELEEKKKEEEDKSSSRFSSFPIRGLNTLSGPKGEPSQNYVLSIAPLTSVLFQDPFPSVHGSLRSSTLGATRTR